MLSSESKQAMLFCMLAKMLNDPVRGPIRRSAGWARPAE